MTSLLGALWTTFQSLGWLLYFLRQLISDTLNVNYRLVTAAGHLIAGIAKIVYMLLNSASLAIYEVVNYVLSTFVGIFSFVIECLYFVAHCCALLFKIIYYTVSGVANGLGFVLLMPICACQTIHSWIMWIFNTERWLYGVPWCLQTCSNALSVAGENTWSLVLSLVVTVGCWISVGTTVTCEYVILLCSTLYSSFLSLITGIAEAIAFVLSQILNSILMSVYYVSDFVLAALVNSVIHLTQLSLTSYLCLIPILLSLLTVTLFFYSRQWRRLLPRFLQPSGEVIRINLDDDDVIEVSDDEQDLFVHHPGDVIDIANDDEYDTEEEESVIAESSDDSDGTNIGENSDIDDSDAETIDVQLPDQPSTSRAQHGYATRSKGNVSQLQEHLDQERERSLCVICQDQVKSVLVLPCRHMCMCVDCARTVVSGAHGQRRICPLCRSNIRMVMNVYT